MRPAHQRYARLAFQSHGWRYASALLWVALIPATALASRESVSIRTEPADCGQLPYDAGALQHALDIELRLARLSEAQPSWRPTVELVLPTCSADETRLAVVITLPPGSAVTHLRAEFSLADMARESRPRTLAVAIVELLRGATATGDASAESTLSPRAPTPRPFRREAVARRLPRATAARKTWTPSYEAYATSQELHQSNAFHGGGLALQLVHAGGRSLRLSADGEVGTIGSAWGTISVRTLGLSLYAAEELAHEPRLTLGPGMRFLGTQAAGDTSGGGDSSPRYLVAGAPGVLLGVAAPLGRGFRLKATFELGYFLREANFLVESRAVVSLSGLHTAVSLGASYGD